MIEAAKSPLVTWFLARDAEARLRRSFDAWHVGGISKLRGILATRSVLVVSNHTSWWDPIVLQWLCHRVLQCDAYAMMDARNLERLPFFRRVGAFGVDLTSARDGVRAIQYGAGLLERPGRLVWIFPQGKETPITRPLVFRPGAAAIARRARAAVVPVGIRYELGATAKPTLWVSIGAEIDGMTTSAQEAAVGAELARIDAALEDNDFPVLHRSSESTMFRFAESALSWLTR
jgi:1-acyl-sn-glycerol-3-phosphate acyltransferase